MMFIGNLNYVLVAVVGALQVASGSLSLGGVQAFIQYSRQFSQPLDGMYTPLDKAEQILGLLVEGCSINTIERVTGVHHGTILKLLVVAGEKCEKLMGRVIVNIPVRDVQCDEIWAFVQKKEGHKAPFEADNDGIGDAYCFVAIERYTKLVLNFALGRRSQATTDAFIEGRSE